MTIYILDIKHFSSFAKIWTQTFLLADFFFPQLLPCFVPGALKTNFSDVNLLSRCYMIYANWRTFLLSHKLSPPKKLGFHPLPVKWIAFSNTGCRRNPSSITEYSPEKDGTMYLSAEWNMENPPCIFRFNLKGVFQQAAVPLYPE